MTFFAAPRHGRELDLMTVSAVVRPISRRDRLEALGLLLGTLGILLGLVLTLGGAGPIGQ